MTDLIRATADIKTRCERVAVSLTSLARQPDAVFRNPRDVLLELMLAGHEVEAATHIVRKAWWP